VNTEVHAKSQKVYVRQTGYKEEREVAASANREATLQVHCLLFGKCNYDIAELGLAALRGFDYGNSLEVLQVVEVEQSLTNLCGTEDFATLKGKFAKNYMVGGLLVSPNNHVLNVGPFALHNCKVIRDCPCLGIPRLTEVERIAEKSAFVVNAEHVLNVSSERHKVQRIAGFELELAEQDILGKYAVTGN